MSKATEQGFVVGQLYRLKHDEMTYSHFREGQIVRFERDDNTDIPFFRRISDEEGSYCALDALETTNGDSVKPAVQESDISYKIDVSKLGTTVVVDRPLTMDQITRIMNIIGEK